MSTTDHDRRVHATGTDGTSVVRYDRAGKWYVEGPAGRKAVTLRVAAAAATILSEQGGRVYDTVGGQQFRGKVGTAEQGDRDDAATALVKAGGDR